MTVNQGKQQMQPIGGSRKGRTHVLEVIGNASMGGMENYLKNFITNLPPDQFKVTCICPYESSFTTELRQLAVDEVYITPIEDDPAWRSIQLTVEVARLHQVDVLHAHMPKAHALAGLAGSLLHKPVVATIHGMNVTSHELGITRAVGSHVITNCQEAYTQALAMGITADRVDLVRNGIDINLFTPANNGDELRKAINVPRPTPLVGFVGRLEHEKGPDLFVRAMEYVHRQMPDAHFVIVGDGCMRNELVDMCERMQLDQHIHFVGWWHNTPDVYPALDLLAHTSRSDGTSLVLLEAMSSGCPTVGLAVGGIREVIEHEVTGFLAGPGDWERIGMRTVQLLEQPDRLEMMKTAARERVETCFNIGTNTRRVADILQQVAFGLIDSEGYAAAAPFVREIVARAPFDSPQL
jgi:glycosyltransferase involved in cell wall biosynthesis